jgi:hypothetical protein
MDTMSNYQKYGPSLTLARLYERQSKKSGNYYLTGRIGLLKVAILKTSDTTDDGVPIWNVVLQESPRPERDRSEEQPAGESGEHVERKPKANSYRSAKTADQSPLGVPRRFSAPDAEIPF